MCCVSAFAPRLSCSHYCCRYPCHTLPVCRVVKITIECVCMYHCVVWGKISTGFPNGGIVPGECKFSVFIVNTSLFDFFLFLLVCPNLVVLSKVTNQGGWRFSSKFRGRDPRWTSTSSPFARMQTGCVPAWNAREMWIVGGASLDAWPRRMRFEDVPAGS